MREHGRNWFRISVNVLLVACTMFAVTVIYRCSRRANGGEGGLISVLTPIEGLAIFAAVRHQTTGPQIKRNDRQISEPIFVRR